MTVIRFRVAVVLCCALQMPALALAHEVADRAAVIDTMQQWERAVEAADFDKLEGFYEENAIYYPNRSEPLIGRARIMENNRLRGAQASVDITQAVDDVSVNGNRAVYSCRATVKVTKPGQDAESVRHVRVLLVLQKGEDGRWRILRDIDNEPAQEAATP